MCTEPCDLCGRTKSKKPFDMDVTSNCKHQRESARARARACGRRKRGAQGGERVRVKRASKSTSVANTALEVMRA
jgi:hypothetical protein